MKKVQRSFAVEYKSGRRKPDSKSNSIWGNMDLKSVARDVEEETMPFLQVEQMSGKPDREMSQSRAAFAMPVLTPPIEQHTTTGVTQETIMADEMPKTDAPAVVETPMVAKKQRQPRAKKGTPEAAPADAAAESVVVATSVSETQKRGRKARSIDGPAIAKRAPVKRAPRAVQAAAVAPTEPAMQAAAAAASYEMADLVQLEEENHRLRKLLAEKLRAENADLRKRLKLD